MSQEEDGGRYGNTIDLTRRVDFRDEVTALADDLVVTLGQHSVTPETYLTALILALEAVCLLTVERGASVEEVRAIRRAAVERARHYKLR